MIESMFSLLRLAGRQRLLRIWLKAQEKDVDELNDEERLLAEIMIDHADEYFNRFEFADVIEKHVFDAEIGTDPFRHVALRAVVENQFNPQRTTHCEQRIIRDAVKLEALNPWMPMTSLKWPMTPSGSPTWQVTS